MPQLRLFSKPSIKVDDTWQPLPKGKSSAVLYYLAYQGDWVSRDELLYLFWPDTSDKQARSNLRSLLSRSIGKLEYVSIETENDTICWQVKSDVARFKQALEADDIEKVIDLYQGHLLEGYHCGDALAFEEWLELEREELLRLFKDKTASFASNLLMDQNYSKAAEVLKKVLDQDPFDEITFRQYLKAIFLSEGQSKAEKVFTDYQKALSKAFDAVPDEHTFGLMDELSTGTIQSPIQGPAAIAVKTKDKVLHNLPIKLTPFVGRKKERDDLAALLADPVVRLLSIVAPGGMGKTRLAIAVAEEHIGSFADGVWFIPFETLEDPEALVFQLAEGIDYNFSGQEDPKKQLFNYLKEKELLLVTDNLEHLLEGVVFFSDLLEHSPATKILATSREVLDLRAEHVFELGGLGLDKTPSEDTASNSSEAVKLFIQSAQQRDKSFELSEDNNDLVAKICERVAGMPLALELAASWLRVLSLEDIIEELEQSIDILEGQSRDRPDRQQSIRTIFDYSWSLLTKGEQAALAKLAVFQGGFDRKAAKEVTQVTVPILLGLANKSFIRKEQTGRYSQHPLMLQYCKEKFEQLEQNTALILEHAKYFLNFATNFPDIDRIIEPRVVLNAIALDYVNIETAWTVAIAQKDEVLLGNASYNILNFFVYNSRFENGKIFFRRALEALTTESIHHGQLYFSLGHLQGLSGDTNNAISNLQKSLTLLNQSDTSLQEERLRSLFWLFINHGVHGNAETSLEFLSKCHTLAQEIGNDYYSAAALSHMAWQPSYEIEERTAMYRESISVLEDCKGYVHLTWTQRNFATHFNFYFGAYQEALELIDKCINIELKRGWKSRLANFYSDKATFLVNHGQLDQAENYAQQVLHMTQALEFSFDLWSIDNAYFVLAKTAKLRGDLAASKENLLAALQVIQKRRDHSGVYFYGFISNSCELGQLYLLEDNLEAAKDERDKVYSTIGKTTHRDAQTNIHYLYVLEAAIALKQNNVTEAKLQLRNAFDLIQKNNELPNLLTLFTTYAQVLIHENHVSQATVFLQCAAQHPATTYETKHIAEKALRDLKVDLDGVFDFDELVQVLQEV